MADNNKIDIRLAKKSLGITLRWLSEIRRPPEAYRLSDKYGIILYWHHGDYTEKFPAFVPWETFVTCWLEQAEPNKQFLDDFERYYEDGDVSNGKGFRMFNEGWGHVDNDPYAYVAIKPVWMWYGK